MDDFPIEEHLAGGNMSGVVRVGDRVHRAAGAWTPTVHRLLRHLHDRGVAGVPQPLGLDADGREVVTYVPGTVPQDPMPGWVWTDAVLAASGRRLAALHQATRDFDLRDSHWQSPSHQPVEVVCHNDFAPYNLVFDDDHELTGVIDWDTASPGPAVWDLAYLAYRLVPLGDPSNPDLLDNGMDDRRRRLALLCHAYGHGLTSGAVAVEGIDRLHEMAEFTAARAAAGAVHVAGHVGLYLADAGWLAAHREALS